MHRHPTTPWSIKERDEYVLEKERDMDVWA